MNKSIFKALIYFSPAPPLWLLRAGPLLGNTSWSLSCILSCSQSQNWTWNKKEYCYCVVWQNWPEFSMASQVTIIRHFTLFTVSKMYFLVSVWLGKIFVSIKIFGWEKIFVNAGDISLSSAQLALIYKIGMSLCLACDWSESQTSGTLIGQNTSPDIPDQFES